MKIKGFEKSGAKYNQLLINVFFCFVFLFSNGLFALHERQFKI
jgi:hypothetical protein